MIVTGWLQSGSGDECFAAFPLGFLDELGDAVQAGVHLFCLQLIGHGQCLAYIFRAIAVGQDVQFRAGDQFKIRLFIDHVGKGFGFVDALIDENFVAFSCEDFQA